MPVAKRRAAVSITKRIVDAARPGRKDYFLWDSGLVGFGLRVFPSGRKIYYVKYGLGRRGKGRKIPLGEHGASLGADPRTGRAMILTVELARLLAAEKRRTARRGLDPGESLAAVRDIPTLRAFVDAQYLPYAEGKKAAGTLAGDRRHLKLLDRRFGSRRLDQIGPRDAELLHLDLRGTPVKANRVLALLSTIVNRAKAWHVLGREHENPCDIVEAYPEIPRERRLSDDEMSRAGEALAVAEAEGLHTAYDGKRTAGAPHASPTAIAALRTIIFTGARPGEICELQTPELDLERRLIVKRTWKTRGKTRIPASRAIPLSPEACIVLEGQLARKQKRKRHRATPYVFPGRTKGQAITVSGLDGVWERIRSMARLEDVRLSDLGRHNFASEAADLGYTLNTIGKILGHTQERTTSRYAHLGGAATGAAVAAVSSRIAAKLAKRTKR